MSFKMNRLVLVLVTLLAWTCPGAENPLLGMFGDDVTLFVPFDDGTINPSVGELKPRPSSAPVIAEDGVFGKRLAAGTVLFDLDSAGREAFDTMVPGTVLCWVRAEYLPEPTRLEPAMRFFLAQSKDAKRKLHGMKRGGAAWGWGPIETFYEVFNSQGGRQICHATRTAPIAKWVPGEWRLMAVTWTPEMIGFSLDGGPFVYEAYSQALGSFDGMFSWSAPAVSEPAEKRLYSIDDCAIVGRAVSDAEIRKYYEASMAVRVGKPNPYPVSAEREQRTNASLVGLRFAYYPSYNRFHVKITAASLMRKTSATGAFALSVRAKDGKVLKTYRLQADASGNCEAILEAPDLAAQTRASGCPDYEFVLTADGVADCQVVRVFRRSVFDWEGTQLGCSAAIPPPFAPMEVKQLSTGDLAVGTRCKWHQLDRLGLWKNVRVKMSKEEYGAESAPENAFGVMSAPMRLEATKHGRTEVLVGKGTKLLEQAPNRVHMISSFAGPLSGKADAEWEMDGQMVWTLTLESGEVEALRLVIPFDGRKATLMQACADGVRINFGGAIPAGTGRVWDGTKARRNQLLGSYVPYLWIGGPVAGISVYGDNDRGWVVGEKGISNKEEGISKDDNSSVNLNLQPQPSQEIIRQDDGTVELVLNLIAKPTKIDSPRTIKLGFLATPVKPMEKNWRSERFGELIGSCFAWGAHVTALDFQTFDPTDSFWKAMASARSTGDIDRDFVERYLETVPYADEKGSPEQLKKADQLRKEFLVGLRKASGAKSSPLVFYTNGRGIATGVEPGRTFLDEWMLGEFQIRKDSAFSGEPYSMDPAPSLVDYQLSCFKRMLESGACDRLYWDDVFLSPNFSPVGTDAYETPDGRQPSCGIFRMREQVKRTAIMQQELGYDPRHNWIHMTDTPMAPVSAFAGIHYDFEDAQAATSMQERYSRERLLAGSLGRQFGVPVAAMAYYAKGDKKKAAAIERSSTGVALTFEFWWRRGPESYHALYRKLRDWGYGREGLKVWNWWDGPRYPLRVEGIESSSIVMSRGDAGLIIVSNWGKDGVAKLTLDAVKVGLGDAATLTDFETGEPVAMSNGTLELLIKQGDFRMIEWRLAK